MDGLFLIDDFIYFLEIDIWVICEFFFKFINDEWVLKRELVGCIRLVDGFIFLFIIFCYLILKLWYFLKKVVNLINIIL